MRMFFGCFIDERGESHREERETNEGLIVFRDQVDFRDQIGQFWNVMDLVDINPNLRVC